MLVGIVNLSNTSIWQKWGLNKKENGILRIRAGEGMHFIISSNQLNKRQTGVENHHPFSQHMLSHFGDSRILII